MKFIKEVFELEAYYESPEFGEFVLPSGFRLAFFRVTGKAARFFKEATGREGMSMGVTVRDVDVLYTRVESRLEKLNLQVSGPPKEHPWGEKSFLLIDPDGNRWEITKSPTEDGNLVNIL